MTSQGDPNRPPLQDDPSTPPLRDSIVEDRGFSILPILAAAVLVLVLGYLFLGPSGDQVTTPTSAPNTRIERPMTPAPVTTPAPSQTTPAEKPSPN
jgi:hypothetical protein